MASSSLLSKFIANASSVQNELSLAVANLNLDFTLIRLEAPTEFKGINNSLSEIRRESAESGALHRTTRKLGALFDGIPPPAPNLLSAYGIRVSEICEKANIDPNERERHGIFSRFSGADSASLWAAATSGTNAIAVHLLACMIAGIFDGSQAVSLWWELIQRRKLEIEKTIEEEMDGAKTIAKALATKQEFSREEIASWENSARSWIRTANSAVAKQRETALLCTDKAAAAVNMISDPYESVMQAWRDAMLSMDSLVKGISQKVRNGAVLLAINSWHLYPDMCVMSRGPGLIYQKDPLINKSGILTIDLEGPSDVTGGIFWSLPLSYLRYYGGPVSVTQRFGVSSSRISMDQFRFVLLGCVLSTWDDLSVPDSIEIISQLLEALRLPERSGQSNFSLQQIISKTSWIGQLLSAVDDFPDGSKEEQDMARKLIGYGRRNPHFLCEPDSYPAPLFGLCHIPSLFSLLEGPARRIAYLRQLAKDLGLSNSNCVIQYFYSESLYEYATIEPIGNHFGKSDSSGYIRRPSPSPQIATKHIRWIPIKTIPPSCTCGDTCLLKEATGPQGESRTNLFRRKDKDKDKTCPCWGNGGCSIECHNWKSVPATKCLDSSLESRMNYIQSIGEYCLPVHQIPVFGQGSDRLDFGNGVDFQASLIDLSQSSSNSFVRLEFCAGDNKTAMILKRGPMTKGNVDPRKGHPGENLRELGHFLQADTIRKVFRPQDFNYHNLTTWFETYLRTQFPLFVRPLRACAAAAELYGRLPETSVASSIIGSVSLTQARWIPLKEPPDAPPLRLKLSRPEAFACIAMFESGRILDPAYLQSVFAMTSEDSFFVASPMLSDPYEIPLETEIKRVPGNIGQPGLSFLIPPPDPRIRKANSDAWTVLSHKEFEGEIEDSFWQTSMHLCLTQYQPTLQGLNQDEHFISEGTALRETLVQVYDGSEWVCDLDILSTLKSPLLSRVVCQNGDGHPGKQPLNLSQKSFRDASKVFSRMVTVDNWEELLIPPVDQVFSIVRTSGNWLGRLAAVGVGIRLRRPTVILSKEICWVCVERHVKNLKLRDSDTRNIILIL